MIRTVIALALLAAPSFAQVTGSRCSDTTVTFQPTRIEYGHLAECSGTQLTIGSTRLDQARNKCPQLVVVTPAHYAPKHSPGCGTDAEIATQSPIVSYQYRCSGTYLLMFRLSADCVLVDKHNVGSIPTYTPTPCNRADAVTIAGSTE